MARAITPAYVDLSRSTATPPMHIRLYLFRQLALSVLLVTGVLTMAVWLLLSLRPIEFALATGTPIGLLLQMLLTLPPTFLPMILPTGVIVGVLFCYNRLSQDSELIVMRAAGLGPGALAMPALAVAAITMALGFLLTLQVSPSAHSELVKMQQIARSSLGKLTLREGQFTDFGSHLTIYVRDQQPTGELRGLFIRDRRDPEKPATLVAAEGQFLRGSDPPRILVRNGMRQEFDRERGRTSELSFERYTIELELPQQTSTERQPDARERSTTDLITGEGSAQLPPRTQQRLIVELHQRFALPLLIPAMAMLALLAVLNEEHNRRGRTPRIAAAAVAALMVQVTTLAVLNLSVERPAIILATYLPIVLTVLAPVVLWLNRARIVTPRPAAP